MSDYIINVPRYNKPGSLEEIIRNIYLEIFGDKSKPKDNAFIIDLCERHKEIFEPNSFVFKSSTFNELLLIIAQYAISLVYKWEYKKAIPFINQAISLYDLEPEKSTLEKLKYPWYEHLYYVKAWALIELKKYNEAKKILDMLVYHNPEKIKFRNLLIRIKAEKINRLQLFLAGGMILCLILKFNVKWNTYLSIKPVLDFSVGILFIGIILINAITYLYKKKIKSPN